MNRLIPKYVNYTNRPETWIEISQFSKEFSFSSAYLECTQYVLDFDSNCIRMLDKDERVGFHLFVITNVYRLKELDKIVIITYHLQHIYVVHPIVYKLYERGVILTPTYFKRAMTKRKGVS